MAEEHMLLISSDPTMLVTDREMNFVLHFGGDSGLNQVLRKEQGKEKR